MGTDLQVKIDMLDVHNRTAEGAVAQQILNNMKLNPMAMRPWLGSNGQAYITVYNGGDPADSKNYSNVPVRNATLRRDEWKLLDEEVVRVADQKLRGVNDLKSRGLVKSLGNAMGTTVYEYHTVKTRLQTTTSMDGIARGIANLPNFETNYLPLPIVHVDYPINHRLLMSSRNMGTGIDTYLAEEAARAVAETLEDMLFGSKTYAYGGGTIYSYVRFPHRNTVTLTKNWNDSTKTGKEIIADVVNMINKSMEANHDGPFVLYIPSSYHMVLAKDYDDQARMTIRARLLEIPGLEDIVTIPRLADHNLILLETSSGTVKWLNGMPIQNVQWNEEGGMVTNFKVMTIQVPLLISDQEEQSGITHMAPA